MKRVSKNLPKCQAILWTATTTKDGLHPVKIRVTYARKSKYYNVQIENGGKVEKLYLTPDQWQKAMQPNPRGENRQRRIWINAAETIANNACKDATGNNRLFTFDQFERAYLSKEAQGGILKLFERILSELQTEGRIGTYKAYKNAYSAFKSFRNGKDLHPADLTPKVLRAFEAYLRKPKKSANRKTLRAAGTNTVAMYMRALRVVFNEAVSDNPALKDFYPFAKKKGDKKGYAIKAGAGKKGEALTAEELQRFLDTETQSGTPEYEAKQLWLFSFYCQGMNMRDIAYLKYANIKADHIAYIRRKTENTEANEELMEVPLTSEITDIIVSLGSPDKRPDAYVFSIITDRMNPMEQDATIRQKIKITNKWLKRLCEANELPAITTYWARHSYASLLKARSVPVEMIRELLGHSDVKTTERYLQKFDLDEKRKTNQKIYPTLKAS